MEEGGDDAGGEDAGGVEGGGLEVPELPEEDELEDDVVADDEAVEVSEAEAAGIAESAAAAGAEGPCDEPPPHEVQMSAAAKAAITDLIVAPPHGMSCRVRIHSRRKRARYLNRAWMGWPPLLL